LGALNTLIWEKGVCRGSDLVPEGSCWADLFTC